MKKIINENKKVVLGLIIGILLTSNVALVFALSASDINYKDGKVSDALNELYETISTESSYEIFDSYSSGTRLNTRSTSLNLEKGKYIIFTNINSVGDGPATPPNPAFLVYSDTNGSCQRIFSDAQAGSASLSSAVDYNAILLCNVVDTETVSVSGPSISSRSNLGEVISIRAVKID